VNFGYSPLARYTFLGLGFGVVMVVGMALALVYVIGAMRGKRAASQWVDACVAGLAFGSAADAAFALLSGQLSSFLKLFGAGPLFEMLALAALFLGTMWFMAIRYTEGLED
jgi:hypothetical protein